MSVAEHAEKALELKARALGRHGQGTAPILRETRRLDSGPSALLLIAGNVNYFYDRSASGWPRPCEPGVDVQLATLRDFPVREFDCCFMVGLGEVVAGHCDQADALKKLAEIRAVSRFTVVWNFESMATHWFTTPAIWRAGLASTFWSTPRSIARMVWFPQNSATDTSSSSSD